jgi:hypothetical protein
MFRIRLNVSAYAKGNALHHAPTGGRPFAVALSMKDLLEQLGPLRCDCRESSVHPLTCNFGSSIEVVGECLPFRKH